MFSLPPILEEDAQAIQAALGELVTQSEATVALLTDQGGVIIATHGTLPGCDFSPLAALAAGAYTASQEIAKLLYEPSFTSIFQQGERFSMCVIDVAGRTLLIVIFESRLSVGMIKYYATATVQSVANQLAQAQARAPNEGLDLSRLNVTNVNEVFRKRAAANKPSA